MQTHFIYLLEHSDNSFYIGQTINIRKRMNEHKKSFSDPFTFTIIDECGTENALLFERMWMQLFYSWGFKLKNQKPWININTKQRLTAGSKIINDKIDIKPYLVSERLIKLPKGISGFGSFEEYKLFRRRIIGSWIGYLRGLDNITQKQLADELGIEQSTLCKIESGKRNYSAVTLLFICKFLKVDFTSTLEIF